MRSRVSACFALGLFLASCTKNPARPPQPAIPDTSDAGEHWPAFSPSASWTPLVTQAVSDYTTAGYAVAANLQNYQTDGDFLNYSVTQRWVAGPVVQLDADGVPMIKCASQGGFYYNPETVIEWTLAQYGLYIRGVQTADKMLIGLNRLASLQDRDGALRYSCPFYYYLTKETLAAGWVSGMTQAEALAAYARGYLVTKDPKWIALGQAALTLLQKRTADGGATTDLAALDPSLDKVQMYDEYPAHPSGYTLNGFMFGMLGVYDWTQVAPDDSVAARSFRNSVHALTHILPYYDLNGFSAYDLGHIVYAPVAPHIGVSYHKWHVVLLHALGSITHDPTIAHYEALWRADVPK